MNLPEYVEDVDPRQWYTVAEVAFITKRSESSIHNWIKLSLIPAYQPGGPRKPWMIKGLDVMNKFAPQTPANIGKRRKR